MQIQKTKNYEQFKRVQGNRVLNQRHLAKLTLSILEDNLLAVNPILVNSKLEVIDGQHRLEVAKANNWDVYYLVLEDAGIEEVRSLNANLKSWTILDYIESYAVQGNKQYQKLLKFMTEYNLAVTHALNLLYGYTESNENSNSKGGGHLTNMLRAGKFDPSENQWKEAELIADIIYEVRAFSQTRGGSLPLGFLYTLIRLSRQGLGKKIVVAIKTRGKMFQPEADKRLAEAQLRGFIS